MTISIMTPRMMTLRNCDIGLEQLFWFLTKWNNTKLKLLQNLEPQKSFVFNCKVLLKVLSKLSTDFGHFASIKMNEMMEKYILCSKRPFLIPTMHIDERFNENLPTF
jgi:hypothetical protein